MERLRQAKRQAPDPRHIEVVDEAVAVILRRKTGTQRMALVAEAWMAARRMIEQSERARQPSMSEAELQERVRRRLRHDAT